MHKTKLQWIALLGKAEISESSIRFVGEPPPKKKAPDDTTVSEDPRSFSILRSDMYFETGDIQGEMFLQDPSSKLQFRLSNEEGRTVFVGVNLGDQPYGITVREDGKIHSISGAGQGSNLPAGEWFPFTFVYVGHTSSYSYAVFALFMARPGLLARSLNSCSEASAL